MLENFSKQFESGFRVFFMVWVSFWGVLNVFGLLSKYASFGGYKSQPGELGYWWMNTFGSVITVAVGVFLLFMMAGIPSIIAKKKKIKNIPMMTVLACVYYLFITTVSIFAEAIFKPDKFTEAFVFLSMWMLPSIILLIVHILYFSNLRKYNEELITPAVID